MDVSVNMLGMTPLAAIPAGTVNAVEPMSWTSESGALTLGKRADMIGVEGDSLECMRIPQHIGFVIKATVVYKSEAAK